jgi:hypothetical protein
MSKNDDDPMKKILERRKFIEDEREVEDDDPFPNISDRTEQPSKEKEKRVDREEVSSPTKGVPPTPSISMMEALARQMENFKGSPVREKPKTELDLEDAWADEPLEESRPIVQREEAPVKKEPGKINVTDGRFDNVAGLFGGGKKKEQPKVGKLKTEAIEALANAKAEDVRRAAERGEAPGESRVSVTSAELQKSSDIPIPPAPPPPPTLEATKEPRVSVSSLESVKGPDIPIPPSPPPAPALKETRTTVAMDESPIPPVEKRKTSVSEIPIAKGNKDLGIVIKDLEQLQQEVSGKIGPKNAKELAGHINKIKVDYNSKSGEEQAQTLQKNLQSLEKWSSEKEKETANKSTWKKIGTVISSCLSLVGAKIAGKETENIKNNLAQAMKELKTGGKKEVGEWVSKIKQEANKNQQRSR